MIRFGTNLPVQATVYWGKTADYELGSLTSNIFLSDYSVLLPDLTPGTHYFFKVVMTEGHGLNISVSDQEFTTLALPDTVPPANVSNFQARPTQTDITLTWNNPQTDFSLVRIVKSDKFYPRDPTEGQVIYEGRGEQYIDTDVVPDKVYYYTAFSLDRAGNYSSGALTDTRLLRPGENFVPPKLFADVLQLPKDLIDILLRNFHLNDINFIQDGKTLPIVSNTVNIRGDQDLTISIDYNKMPEILKTIAITMYDPDDHNKTFSFLLRINADKTAYEAHIGAFEKSGRYEFNLNILDSKHQGLVSIAGTLIVKMSDIFGGKNGPGGFASVSLAQLLLIAMALFVLLLLWLLVKRRYASAHYPSSAPLYKKP